MANVMSRRTFALAAIALCAVLPAGALGADSGTPVVPIPPVPVLLDECTRDEGRGVELRFVDVDSIPVSRVTVRFSAGSAAATSVLAGDYQPNAPSRDFVDPKLETLVAHPRVSTSPIACTVTAVTYGDGTTWTPKTAVNVPSAPPAAPAPVRMTNCAYDPARQQLALGYQNDAKDTIDAVRVRVNWSGGRTTYVREGGPLRAGAALSRTVPLLLGTNASPVPPVGVTCTVARTHAASGTVWSDARLDNTTTMLFPQLGMGLALTQCAVGENKILDVRYRNRSTEPISSATVRVNFADKSTTFEIPPLGARAAGRYTSEDIGQVVSETLVNGEHVQPSCTVLSVAFADGERWPL